MAHSIRSEIHIQASPDVVWKHLIHFNDYPKWNPMIRKIRGTPILGGKLKIQVSLSQMKRMRFSPTITGLIEKRLLSWRGQLGIPGLFDGEHRYIIEPVSENETRFVQEEDFTGLLTPFLMPFLEGDTLSGFEAMNRALKLRSETDDA